MEGHGHSRRSSSLTDSNGDGDADGRDVTRAGVALDWRRDWVLPGGIVGTALARASGDVTYIGEDPDYPSRIERTLGVLGR